MKSSRRAKLESVVGGVVCEALARAEPSKIVGLWRRLWKQVFKDSERPHRASEFASYRDLGTKGSIGRRGIREIDLSTTSLLPQQRNLSGWLNCNNGGGRYIHDEGTSG